MKQVAQAVWVLVRVGQLTLLVLQGAVVVTVFVWVEVEVTVFVLVEVEVTVFVLVEVTVLVRTLVLMTVDVLVSVVRLR
jgi:hypothetical protein